MVRKAKVDVACGRKVISTTRSAESQTYADAEKDAPLEGKIEEDRFYGDERFENHLSSYMS